MGLTVFVFRLSSNGASTENGSVLRCAGNNSLSRLSRAALSKLLFSIHGSCIALSVP